MKRVKYTGVSRMGTLQPRRMWAPGEILKVEDGVAEELVKSPYFTLVQRKKRTKKPEKKSDEKPEETSEEKPEEKNSEE